LPQDDFFAGPEGGPLYTRDWAEDYGFYDALSRLKLRQRKFYATRTPSSRGRRPEEDLNPEEGTSPTSLELEDSSTESKPWGASEGRGGRSFRPNFYSVFPKKPEPFRWSSPRLVNDADATV
jgi:hypothetical protein